MSMLAEFKKFAMRGNVVDMAVGIIIGGAFGTIIKSLVDDVVMPPIGMLTSKVDFKELALPIKEPVVDAAGKVTSPGVAIYYGSFINNVITFLIIAFAVFLLVKAMNAMTKREEAAPAPPSEEVLLLRQIRDSLKKA